MKWVCPRCNKENEDTLDIIQMEYVGCRECDKLFEIDLDNDGNIESIKEF